ncbi:MAG: MFS transporter, partial [Desulfocucumaceae bacterium]
WAQGMGRIASALAPIFVGFMVVRSIHAMFYVFAGSFVCMAILVIIFGIETKGKSLEEISK